MPPREPFSAKRSPTPKSADITSRAAVRSPSTSTHANARLQDWWPDPDTFNPGRFTTTAQHDAVNRYAFAPFGGGAHKCIGQQFADMTVKTVMLELLCRFQWSSPVGYRCL